LNVSNISMFNQSKRKDKVFDPESPQCTYDLPGLPTELAILARPEPYHPQVLAEVLSKRVHITVGRSRRHPIRASPLSLTVSDFANQPRFESH
jgi:hypothetical protein